MSGCEQLTWVDSRKQITWADNQNEWVLGNHIYTDTHVRREVMESTVVVGEGEAKEVLSGALKMTQRG